MRLVLLAAALATLPLNLCAEPGRQKTGNEMIRTGLLKKDKPFLGEDFYDDTVFKRVVEKRPEFFADLAPLAKTLAECKGPLD